MDESGAVLELLREGVSKDALPLVSEQLYQPCTVRTDNAPKVRFSALLGEEPEVDQALV